jgi:aerobic-type carbon monoxide dehydrogenase small subunit (CoxS/CutS family)
MGAEETASEPEVVDLIVNGRPRQAHPQLYPTLLQALREEFGLTGTKYGCGEGLCGACTVLIDGRAARCCQMPTQLVQGKEVTTIEGLAENGRLHALQQAFIDEDAMQCGYCSPGMIMNAAALLRENPRPNRDEIIEKMNGNICRCNNYNRIIAAIRKVADR